MGKFQQKLYKFMYGRYGVDKLYSFCAILIIVALLVNVLASIFIKNADVQFWVSTAIMLFDVIIISWSTFRFLSKNIYKRRRENERFLKISREERESTRSSAPDAHIDLTYQLRNLSKILWQRNVKILKE